MSKVVISRQGIIVKADDAWIFVAGTAMKESSLLALVTLKNKSITEFLGFLSAFNLTVRDVFLDNPEKTSAMVRSVCKRIKGRAIKGRPIESIKNGLKTFLEALSDEPGAATLCIEIKATLDEVAGIENQSAEEVILTPVEEEPTSVPPK